MRGLLGNPGQELGQPGARIVMPRGDMLPGYSSALYALLALFGHAHPLVLSGSNGRLDSEPLNLHPKPRFKPGLAQKLRCPNYFL